MFPSYYALRKNYKKFIKKCFPDSNILTGEWNLEWSLDRCFIMTLNVYWWSHFRRDSRNTIVLFGKKYLILDFGHLLNKHITYQYLTIFLSLRFLEGVVFFFISVGYDVGVSLPLLPLLQWGVVNEEFSVLLPGPILFFGDLFFGDISTAVSSLPCCFGLY